MSCYKLAPFNLTEAVQLLQNYKDIRHAVERLLKSPKPLEYYSISGNRFDTIDIVFALSKVGINVSSRVSYPHKTSSRDYGDPVTSVYLLPLHRARASLVLQTIAGKGGAA